MTREEAIIAIRGFMGQLTEDCQEALISAIPELAESEDERIRRDIVAAVEMYKDFSQRRKGQIYAWLEKQKDNKFAPRVLPCSAAWFEDGEEKQEEQKPVEPSGKLSRQDYLYQLLIDQLITYSDYEYLIGQKPAEWSKNDTIFLNEITDFFENKTVRLQHDIDMYAHWLKSLPERFNLQPKEEWSEEDEEILDGIINTLDRLGYAEFCKSSREEDIEEERFYYKEIQCLKKLKSLRPQSKDETYKEKDEAFKLGKHQLAITFIKYLDENRQEGKMCLSNSECEDIDKAFMENNWAKIMRYAEKYWPQWKPSEEQMRALTDALEDMPEHYKPKCTLESLERDLKKLM